MEDWGVGNSLRHLVLEVSRESVQDLLWYLAGDTVGDYVWASVRKSIWDSGWGSVWSSAGNPLQNSIEE